MARSFSSAKVLSAFLADSFSIAVSRRGYALASQGAVAGSVRGGVNVMPKKSAEESSTKPKSSWVPDPKTGYYRPENHANDVDVAELREMLLKTKVRRT